MQRMTRMVCIVGLLSAGCAATGGESRGELLFVVETDQALGRLVFTSDGPVPFQLAGAEEGVTIYRQVARAGTYCLEEVTTGNLTVGYTFGVSPPACTRVEPGKRVYGGHFVISGTGFRRVADLERLARQLRDPSIAVVASPPELAEQPFQPSESSFGASN